MGGDGDVKPAHMQLDIKPEEARIVKKHVADYRALLEAQAAGSPPMPSLEVYLSRKGLSIELIAYGRGLFKTGWETK